VDICDAVALCHFPGSFKVGFGKGGDSACEANARVIVLPAHFLSSKWMISGSRLSEKCPNFKGRLESLPNTSLTA
jgi:hypothetical protein